MRCSLTLLALMLAVAPAVQMESTEPAPAEIPQVDDRPEISAADMAAIDEEVLSQFTQCIARINGSYPGTSPFLKASARAHSLFERLYQNGSREMKGELTGLAFRLKIKLEERHWTRKKKMVAFHSFMREVFANITKAAQRPDEKRMAQALRQNLTIAINPLLAGIGAALGRFPWFKAATAALLLGTGAYAGYRLYQRHAEKEAYEKSLQKDEGGNLVIKYNQQGQRLVAPVEQSPNVPNKGHSEPDAIWVPYRPSFVQNVLALSKDALTTTNRALTLAEQLRTDADTLIRKLDDQGFFREIPGTVRQALQSLNDPNTTIAKLASSLQALTGADGHFKKLIDAITNEIEQTANKRLTWLHAHNLCQSATEEKLKEGVRTETDPESGATYYSIPAEEAAASTLFADEIKQGQPHYQANYRTFVLQPVPAEKLFMALDRLTKEDGKMIRQEHHFIGQLMHQAMDRLPFISSASHDIRLALMQKDAQNKLNDANDLLTSGRSFNASDQTKIKALHKDCHELLRIRSVISEQSWNNANRLSTSIKTQHKALMTAANQTLLDSIRNGIDRASRLEPLTNSEDSD